jgi:drug/metabolite transporter (DMT)-like permease
MLMTSTTIFFLLMLPGTFLLALLDIFNKRILQKGFDHVLLQAYSWFFAGILLFPVLLFVEATSQPYEASPLLAGMANAFSKIAAIPRAGFWSAFFATALLNVAGQLSFLYAFKKADASLIGPVRLITMPLVIITGFFVLGEMPSFWGTMGILTSLTGIWLLAKPEKQLSVSFWQNGIVWAIFGAVIFAISSAFDKKAVVTSSTLFFSVLVLIFVGGACFCIVLYRNRTWKVLAPAFEHRKNLVMIILLTTGGFFLVTHALNYAFVAYAISVKRLWSLWTVLLAGAFLKEDIKKRLVATLIMLAGVFLIAFAG